MESKAKKIYAIIPYILFLIFSLFGTYLVFYKGMNNGDDYKFHMPNIMEQYETLLNYHKLSPISGILAMGLGSGTRLFYSPLPHLTVTLLALFMRLYNVSLMTSYKIVIVLSVFISGIFMYRLAMHFTSNNKVASTIAACCFILYPYRIFDAFCRLAFAEAYSIMFLPLFFMGIYDILHIKDKVKIMPFVETILGGSLLYLSHNLTAFYMYLAAIIYILCNIHKVIKLFTKKHFVTYCGVSVLLLAGIASIAYVSQFELMGTGLYNLTDDVRMWSDVDTVIKRAGQELDYSGFLNIGYLSGSQFVNKMTASSLIIGLVMYIFSCFIFVVIDKALSEVKKLKYFHTLISTIVLFGLVTLISRRLEIYLGTIVFYLLYLYIFYCFNHPKEEVEETKIYKNILFWYSVAMVVLLFFMMHEKKVWTVLPSIMLKIQFPWRLWALVQLFASILVGLVCHFTNAKKTTSIIFTILVGFLLVSNEPLLEKRMFKEDGNEKKWVEEWDNELLDIGTSLGFNREYCPQVFFKSDYKSEYGNASLYNKVRIRLINGTQNYADYSFKPVFLTGKGSVKVVDAFSPNYTMDIEVTTENAIIQMPLIYYPGYEIVATNISTNEKIKLTSENIDGLISFSLQSGTYKVTTDYIGTTARRISVVVSIVSISLTAVIFIYALFFENKKEKKQNENKKN